MALFIKILLGATLFILFICILSKIFYVEKTVYYSEDEVKKMIENVTKQKDEELAYWKQSFESMRKERNQLLERIKLF